jgi:hypothetical protein
MPPLRRPKRPVPATSQPDTIPAPMGGLNAMSPGMAVPPGDCLAVWNMIASENGLRTRLGYREWCTNLTGTTDNKVRTLMAYAGSEPSLNRLFATTDTYIWAATSSTTTPATAFTFASPSGNAGYGVYRNHVTAGGHYGLYCDEVNGLHVYTQTGATWTAPVMGGGVGEIANIDPGDLVHVAEFKQRLWFTERDSASAWYLPVGQLYGAATEFNFGMHFRQGGHLVGLYTWSYDGGSGMDDALVAVSSGGDVVIYQGIDPSDPDSFNKRGTWGMAPPPAGRDIATEVGGDLWILSGTGIMPLSRLVVGGDTKQAETAKIANLFNRLMLTRGETRGWSMHLHPQDNALVLLYPDYSTEVDQQLVQAQGAPGKPWFRYQDLPMHCAAVWEKRLHFGTQDGRVCVSRDDVDGVELADPTNYSRIEWRLLTAFRDLGGRNVRMHLMRPLFSTDGGAPEYSIEARYGFNLSDASTPEAAASAESGTWDNAIWDTDVWGGEATPSTSIRGGTGAGRDVAVALRGTSVARTTLVKIDVLYEVGGWL